MSLYEIAKTLTNLGLLSLAILLVQGDTWFHKVPAILLFMGTVAYYGTKLRKEAEN